MFRKIIVASSVFVSLFVTGLFAVICVSVLLVVYCCRVYFLLVLLHDETS